jgi:hypothetical protein
MSDFNTPPNCGPIIHRFGPYADSYLAKGYYITKTYEGSWSSEIGKLYQEFVQSKGLTKISSLSMELPMYVIVEPGSRGNGRVCVTVAYESYDYTYSHNKPIVLSQTWYDVPDLNVGIAKAVAEVNSYFTEFASIVEAAIGPKIRMQDRANANIRHLNDVIVNLLNIGLATA